MERPQTQGRSVQQSAAPKRAVLLVASTAPRHGPGAVRGLPGSPGRADRPRLSTMKVPPSFRVRVAKAAPPSERRAREQGESPPPLRCRRTRASEHPASPYSGDPPGRLHVHSPPAPRSATRRSAWIPGGTATGRRPGCRQVCPLHDAFGPQRCDIVGEEPEFAEHDLGIAPREGLSRASPSPRTGATGTLPANNCTLWVVGQERKGSSRIPSRASRLASLPVGMTKRASVASSGRPTRSMSTVQNFRQTVGCQPCPPQDRDGGGRT